jgi:hypothetical protein
LVIAGDSRITVAAGKSLTVTGLLDWSAGMITRDGRVIIAPGGVANLTTASGKFLDGVFENRGTTNYPGAGFLFGRDTGNLPARIENAAGGTWIVDGEGDFSQNQGSATYRIDNAGTFIKRGAGTTTVVNNPVAFVNTGTVQLIEGTMSLQGVFTQTTVGATTNLAGGSLSATTLTFAAGRVTGVGTITANVTNSGAVFSPGETGTRTIGITGSYTQQAGGSLEFDLGGNAASGAFDKLTVSGTATLNGTVVLRNSVVLAGEVFPLVTYASRSGTFPTITVENNGTGTASYLATRADFAVTAEEPPAQAPQLAVSYEEWVGSVTQTWGPPPSISAASVPSNRRVTSAAQPSSWEQDPNADPDQDGANNLAEYAFQTNPLDPASMPTLQINLSAMMPGCMEITCGMRSDALDIVLTPEVSSDLKTWSPISAGLVNMNEDRSIPGIKKITLCLNPAVTGNTILRWKVSLIK